MLNLSFMGKETCSINKLSVEKTHKNEVLKLKNVKYEKELLLTIHVQCSFNFNSHAFMFMKFRLKCC